MFYLKNCTLYKLWKWNIKCTIIILLKSRAISERRRRCRDKRRDESKAETRPSRDDKQRGRSDKNRQFRAMKVNKREPELARKRAPLYGAPSIRVSARGNYCHAHKERRTSSAYNADHWSASRAKLHNVSVNNALYATHRKHAAYSSNRVTKCAYIPSSCLRNWTVVNRTKSSKKMNVTQNVPSVQT